MKIYTKTGDAGKTSLFGGKRVEKNSARIMAYGEVDELNSQIGVILVDLLGVEPLLEVGPLSKKLLRIQEELFVLGADLATPQELESRVKSQPVLDRVETRSGRVKVPRIKKLFVTRLEREIDQWEKELPKLKNFILPGGSKVGSKLHLARAITRRAERSIVGLDRTDKINKNVLVYINRLSDWFFIAARYANKLENISEKIWQGRL